MRIPMRFPALLTSLACGVLFQTMAAPTVASAQASRAVAAGLSALDSTTFTALSWRNIGPFRGGRSVAAVGLPSQPLTYVAGYTGGGLWRTDDAGNSTLDLRLPRGDFLRLLAEAGIDPAPWLPLPPPEPEFNFPDPPQTPDTPV